MKQLVLCTMVLLSVMVRSAFAQFSNSNLPIVKITTPNSDPIPDEPKITADMQIIFNGPGLMNNVWDAPNNYNGKIGIEQRGSSSASFPQKSYGFETRNGDGSNLNVPLLGMPADNDWVLHAPYTDKSLLRNVLTYQLWNEMGHYGPRTRFVELLLNGQYMGVYVLIESIKQGDDRVNINKLLPTEISGDDLTGGYIIKVDKTTGGGTGWTSNYNSPMPANKPIDILYHYPKSDVIVTQQANYIRNVMNSVENSLASTNFANPTSGYRARMSITSFADYLIVNEISKNVDGYRISAFFNKDKDSKGGKLKAGPVWDYNIAWWNADYCAGDSYTGWAYNFPTTCPTDDYQVPFWWSRMLQDPYFVNFVRCRYDNFRTNVLDIAKLNTFIDKYALDTLASAQARHFTRWPILGTYVWPNPNTPPAYSSGANNEIRNLKTWIQNRLTWMDANLPGDCSLLPVNLIEFSGKRNQRNVLLTWKTSQEKSVSHYIVEGSADGQHTWEAGTVAAANELGKRDYQLELDYPGTAIYRLKIVDTDGHTEYSDWVQVEGEALLFDDFETYPNPFTNAFAFSFQVHQPTEVSFELLDYAGKSVRVKNMGMLGLGHYEELWTDLDKLNSGVYLLKIQSSQSVLFKKIIKE
ncbi:MAG: CotH kinase family protein [Cytophagaceae bacterium]|nr:CotH kinase family protein [Cytophagaceae bacterium]